MGAQVSLLPNIPLFSGFMGSKSQMTIKNLPPGPPKLPVIGNLHQLVFSGSLPHRSLRELAVEFGPLMHLQLGEVSAVVVSSPKMAHEFLHVHDLTFADRPQLLAPKIITYNCTDIAFAPYGDYWRQMRRACRVELLNPDRVRSFSSIREEEVFNLVQVISSSLGSPVNLAEQLVMLSSSILCKTAFGDRCKDRDLFVSLARASIASAGGFDLADLFPSLEFLHLITGAKGRITKIHKMVDTVIGNIIKEHTDSLICTDEARKEDLVDVLLRLQSSGKLECPITTNNLKAVIMDMFTAGMDTAATTIEWAMSELIKNPRVMEKVQTEIRGALKGKKDIWEADIQELTYLKLVIKETLRLHPPVPMLLPREAREHCNIEGYEIPKKTKVIINAWAIGRDPEYWADAEGFIPERFLNIPFDFVGDDFEYLPFGAGRRICPGMTFGLANLELPLAALLYHFDWEVLDGIKPEDLDMTEIFGANVRRKNQLFLIPTAFTPVGNN